MLETLIADDFAGHLHSAFDLPLADGQTLTLELTEVTAHSPRRPAGLRAGFSLFFQSRCLDYVPQGTYGLSHPVLGDLDLFLVPIGPTLIGMRYQAVFG